MKKGTLWGRLQIHVFLFFMNFLIDYEIKNYISEKRIKNWTGLPFQKFENINQGGITKIGIEFRVDPSHALFEKFFQMVVIPCTTLSRIHCPSPGCNPIYFLCDNGTQRIDIWK